MINYNERLRLSVLVTLRASNQTDWQCITSVLKQKKRMSRLGKIIPHYEEKARVDSSHLTFSIDESRLVKNTSKRV